MERCMLISTFMQWDCEDDSHTLNHLFLKCSSIQLIFACFENQYELADKLTDLEKIIGYHQYSCRVESGCIGLKIFGPPHKSQNIFGRSAGVWLKFG